MTFEIEVKINFRAGHRLCKLNASKCYNVHGEGYTAIFILQSKELIDDMVEDFSLIKKTIKEWIDKNLDHAYLYSKEDNIGHFIRKNKLKTFMMENSPTAEMIAELLYKEIKKIIVLPKIVKVGIIESFDDNIGWYYE